MNEEKDKYHITGKAVERYFDFNDALFEFNQLFSYDLKEDRSLAIFGATFLDLALEHILRAFMPEDQKEVDKLFYSNGALYNFSGKISMSFSLGLIEKIVKDDLHLVRKVRNEFAHNLFATFDDKNIGSWCRDLMWHRISHVYNPPEGVTNKQMFHVGVNKLISHLSGCIGIARGEKREIRDNF